MPTIKETQIEVLVGERPSQSKVRETQVEILVGERFSQAKVRETQVVLLVAEQFTTTTSTTITTTTSTTIIPTAKVEKGLGYAVLGVPDGVVVQKGLGFAVLQATTTSTTSTSTTSTTSPYNVIEDVVIELFTTTTSTTTTSTTVTTTTIDYVEDVVITSPTTTTTTTTSTTGPPPVGTTTTSTTTTSTTVTTTTVTSTTTGPPIGVEWGEESPPESIDKYSWSDWKVDPDDRYTYYTPYGGSRSGWDCLVLYPNIEVFSSVRAMPSGYKTLTVQKNRYGDYCCGSSQYVNIWIRGDTSTFDWDDSSPSWSLYTSPVYANWTYVQLKAKMSLTGTTTTTVTTTSSSSTTTTT